jgi:uncharacterized protein (UPF0276 family)
MNEGVKKFGVGFRPQHYRWITENSPQVDWFEIITENFFSTGGMPRRYLERLRESYPIATHGVSLSIASVDPLNFDYLRKLKELVDWLKPGIVSDHLCWTQYQGVNSHDLLPVPYSMESLENVIQKVEQVQDYLNRQIVLENPSQYLAFSHSEMTEIEFFTELCRSTGCGILLDINNLYVNWKNLGWNPFDAIESFPLKSVKQFHLGGHSINNGILIDTHDAPISNEVWDLYRKAIAKWPSVPTLVEWDDQIPEFNHLAAEMEKAKKIHHEVLHAPSQLPLCFEPTRKRGRFYENVTIKVPLLDKQQSTLYRLIQSGNEIHPKSTPRKSKNISAEPLGNSMQNREPLYFQSKLPLPVKKGLGIYKNAYYIRLHSVLKDTFPVLAFVSEVAGFEYLVSRYIYQCPPTKDSIKYAGEKLHKFLRETELSWDFGVPQEALADLAQLEWSRYETFDLQDDPPALSKSSISNLSPEQWEKVRFRFADSIRLISLNWEVAPVWEVVKIKNEIPSPPHQKTSQYIIYRREDFVYHRKLDHDEAILLREMMEGYSFIQACGALAACEDRKEINKVIPKAVQALQNWLEDSLIVKMSFETY